MPTWHYTKKYVDLNVMSILIGVQDDRNAKQCDYAWG